MRRVLGEHSRNQAADKKDELQQASDGFAEVMANIESGEYDPLRYSSAVYDEARARLGIGAYRDFTTVLEALARYEVADENPFLAYAVERWKVQESNEQLGEAFAVFVGLGLLTVASLLVPGVGGLVLAGLDLALNVGMAASAVENTDDLLDLARLDTDGSVAGISVEQAQDALRTAWIGMGISAVLVGGIGALWSRLVFKAIGGTRVPSELIRLSALMRVDAVGAEALIGKVKNLEQAEGLLELTGDSALLARMLERTTDARQLEFALMSGTPEKVMEALELAGDAATLAKMLDNAPLETAVRVLELADDAAEAAVLLETTSNNQIAITLLEWAEGSTGTLSELVALGGGSADDLLALSRRMDTATAARLLDIADDAAQLDRILSGTQDVATFDRLIESGHTAAELDELLQAGIRLEDIESGIGIPGGGSRLPSGGERVPLPADVIALLTRYGIADAPVLQTAMPHEAARLKTVFGNNPLPRKAQPIVEKAAAQWTVNGATEPIEVVNRWEYLKTRWDDIKAGLNPADYPNQSLDIVTANKLTEELGLGKLTQQLEGDVESVNALVGAGWRPLPASGDVAAGVRAITQELTFGSDTTTAYHVRKHCDELSLAELADPAGPFDTSLAAYVGSARRTIASGTVTAEGERGISALVFTRIVKDAKGTETAMTAKVYVRDGYGLIQLF